MAAEAVEAVIGGVQSEFGTDVTPAVAEIPFDVGIDDEAAAVLAAVVAEAGNLCGHADLRPAGVFAPIGGKARHQGIRFVFIAALVCQRLVFQNRKVGIQAAARRPAAIIQPYTAVEVGVAGDFFVAVKVAVVAAVGDLVEIDTRLKRVGNVVPMLPFRLIAVIPAAFLVVRQPGQVGLAGIIRPQVAYLPVKDRAAFADHAGRERGIEIGGKVEIIGNGKGNAVRTGGQ